MMDAVKFLKTRERMFKFYGASEGCLEINCADCPLSGEDGNDCLELEGDYIEYVRIVETWGQEHPIKTYKDDLLEKYPNAPLKKDGTPCACVSNLGYAGSKREVCISRNLSCKDCWDTEMEE